MADAEHEVMTIDMVEQQCILEPATADDGVFGVRATRVIDRLMCKLLGRS